MYKTVTKHVTRAQKTDFLRYSEVTLKTVLGKSALKSIMEMVIQPTHNDSSILVLKQKGLIKDGSQNIEGP